MENGINQRIKLVVAMSGRKSVNAFSKDWYSTACVKRRGENKRLRELFRDVNKKQ